MKNNSERKVNVAAVLLGILLSCTLLFGCEKQEHQPIAQAKQPATEAAAAAQSSNKEDARWIFKNDPKANVALVFVHGIFGDTMGTWTNDKGKTFFDYVRESPQMHGKADMFAFGFTSDMLSGGSLSVAEASKKLTQSLQFNGVLDYEKIIFVAHSMGGLVVLHNLIHEMSPDELADKVPVVVLLGTPMEGAMIAKVADKIANNSALSDMFGVDKNKFLQQLSDDWKNRADKPTVICGYEKLATNGVLVVGWGSANLLCSRAAPPMDGTSHLSMVKPDRADHPAVILVVNGLNEFTFIDPKAKLETPDFVPEGDHLTIWMNADRTTARIVNASRSKVSYTIGQISDDKFLIRPKTPRVLAAHAPEDIELYLLIGAKESEYSFVLEDGMGAKRKVVARVKDLNALNGALDQRVNKVVAAINNHLANENNAKMLAGFPSDDSRAADTTARVAFEAIKDPNVDISDSTRWLLTADALASARLPQISISAIRQAEAASPEIATTLAAQSLGGKLAADSGVSSIFANVSTPKVEPRTPSFFEWRIAKNDDIGTLAVRLQQIPALKASGLALKGDILTARGQGDAAQKAYMASASIRATPRTTLQMKALNDKGAANFSPSSDAAAASKSRSFVPNKGNMTLPEGNSETMKR